MSTHHPAVESLLGFFSYEHLPPRLQDVSRPFFFLAQGLAGRASVIGHDAEATTLSLDGPELTVALRKLLEAKDCAVRAALAP